MWMVEWSNIVLWVGWHKCLHLDGVLRGTLIIQFAPRMFKGKVGLKVGLKWPSGSGHATGPSPSGSLGLGAKQDKSRHKPTSRVSRSVLHRSANPPTPICLPTGYQLPTTTTGQPTTIPTIQGTNLTNLVSLPMQTIAELNDPLVAKPVMKSKVQKLNHLSGTGKGASSPEGRALISLTF